MINVRLQIGDGEIVDTFEAYSFVYVEADDRFAPPTKGFESTTYAEQEGENIDPRTVDDAFDYKVKFVVLTPNSELEDANKKIRAFNQLLYTKSGDIKTFKTVTFFNDYKKVKIVGTPNPLDEAKDFYRDSKGNVYDAVQVEWSIRVSNPKLCDFSI
jgi:hypothetical protein